MRISDERLPGQLSTETTKTTRNESSFDHSTITTHDALSVRFLTTHPLRSSSSRSFWFPDVNRALQSTSVNQHDGLAAGFAHHGYAAAAFQWHHADPAK